MVLLICIYTTRRTFSINTMQRTILIYTLGRTSFKNIIRRTQPEHRCAAVWHARRAENQSKALIKFYFLDSRPRKNLHVDSLFLQ